MSDRWCDDCAWPEECAAEACCRRRDAGEIRSAAPTEKVAKIDIEVISVGGLCSLASAKQVARHYISAGGRQQGKAAALRGWQP